MATAKDSRIKVPGVSFLLALLFTEVTEGALMLVYSQLYQCPRWPLLGFILLLNGITQPLLWWVLLWQGATAYWVVLLPAEVLIWLVEGLALYAWLRPGWKAWKLSLLLNGSSFALGLVLPI